MADKFYSLDRNATGNPDNVVVGDASAAGSDIEVRIELGTGMTTLEVKERLDSIARRILDGRNQVLGAV